MPDLISGLIDRKIILILKAFSKNRGKTMYLREISRISGVPAATTMRLLGRLVRSGIVREVKVSKFRFYVYDGKKDIEGLLK